MFLRALVKKLGENSAISKATLPVSVPLLLQTAKGNLLLGLGLALAFLLGWAHDEVASVFAKVFRREEDDES